MIYGSVCSGIEAASVAWKPLGWKAAFFSEIEKFPCAVLDHHYPRVPNLGDMTKFKEWPDAIIDVLVGGTPCQSFSIAGLRKGLDDPRGNLMLTYLAIAARYRPEWLVWENVPGVLSSNGGKDFGALLGGLGELGYGFAYRVLDAQHFGVPQRRRRVFVVGHLGDWRRAAAVLFERHSLSGNPAPRRKAGEEITGTIGARTTAGGGFGGDFETAGGLQAVSSATTALPGHSMATGDVARKTHASTGEIAHCLNAGGMGRQDYETETLIAHSQVSFALQHAQIGRKESAGPQGKGWQKDVSFTLDSRSCADVVAFGVGESEEVGHCLRSGASKADKHESTTYIAQSMQVRRLTPRECERLQGFPDDYTLIPGRVADGPRYKALGNSMAVPVMQWIGERINMLERRVS